MTKKHFEHMVSIVRAILAGEWTVDIPGWANATDLQSGAMYDASTIDHSDELSQRYTRAVQTAEAFIVLCEAYNQAFDRQRFLVACGLAAKPSKGRAS